MLILANSPNFNILKLTSPKNKRSEYIDFLIKMFEFSAQNCYLLDGKDICNFAFDFYKIVFSETIVRWTLATY